MTELNALRNAASNCPHPDVVSAAAMGVLPPHYAMEVRAHISRCVLCSVLAEAFETESATEDAYQHSLDRIRAQISNGRRPGRPFILQYRGLLASAAVAAVVIVAVGVGVFLQQRGPQQQNASTPSEPAITRQAFVLPLERAELKLPLDALTWRGTSESTQQKYFADLGKALEPYNRDAFEDSVENLSRLAQQYPRAVEPSFYLGVSYLFLNRNADALAALQRARSLGGAALSSDIEWYVAVAEERSGHPREALAMLRQLCAQAGPYRQSSCDLYPRLEGSTK
jgi:tetratricopeptide (TPR) repeat protein